ncbi:MAG TPA: phosphotransferase [Longimicrobium sp.]|nr:phosphotransferase [Longimicrobium sp.]
MTQPWEAQRVVDVDLAISLIHEQFPGLGAGRIEAFGSGWDNTAFLVDGEIVFRFPRREIAVGLLETEVRALPRIAPGVPLPIPLPEWVGKATERFPWPFAGYRKLAGRTADAAALSEEERTAAAPAIARFLAALHAVSPDGVEVPGDFIHRLAFGPRMPLMLEWLEKLRECGVVDDPEPLLRLFEGEIPQPLSRAALVHGDFYSRHVLVDDDRRACGVIDWGDVHAGDPAVDLSVMYGFLPPSARDDFARAYGEIDARTARLARLRAAFHSVALATFAHSKSDGGLLREARIAMRNVLED